MECLHQIYIILAAFVVSSAMVLTLLQIAYLFTGILLLLKYRGWRDASLPPNLNVILTWFLPLSTSLVYTFYILWCCGSFWAPLSTRHTES